MDHILLNTCACLKTADSVLTSVQNKYLEFKHSPELHLDSYPTLHFLFHAHRLVIEAKNSLGDNFQRLLKGCPQECLAEFLNKSIQVVSYGMYSLPLHLEQSNFKLRYIGSICGLIFIRTRKRKHCAFDEKIVQFHDDEYLIRRPMVVPLILRCR